MRSKSLAEMIIQLGNVLEQPRQRLIQLLGMVDDDDKNTNKQVMTISDIYIFNSNQFTHFY